jgi:hypothetical protein
MSQVPFREGAEQPGQCVLTILASACVGQNIARHRRQSDLTSVGEPYITPYYAETLHQYRQGRGKTLN